MVYGSGYQMAACGPNTALGQILSGPLTMKKSKNR